MKVTFTAPDKLAKKQTYTPDKIKEYEKPSRKNAKGKSDITTDKLIERWMKL